MSRVSSRPDDVSRRAVLGGGLAALLAAGAPARAAGTPRTLGFGLWAGDEAADPARPARIVLGTVAVSGPRDWLHPVTGETLRVWERRNAEPKGDKVQLLALRPDGAALARVFDSRPGRPDRSFAGDAFFPLGPWSEDEERSFVLTEHTEGRETLYRATLRIVKLSHTYRDVPESLRYDWVLADAGGKTVFHERFDYSPGRGLVRFQNRLG
jgi:hypothetical protein